MPHDKDEEELCEHCELVMNLGNQLLNMADGIMAGQGEAAQFDLHYNNNERGMSQPFIVMIVPVHPPTKNGNAPTSGSIQ